MTQRSELAEQNVVRRVIDALHRTPSRVRVLLFALALATLGIWLLSLIESPLTAPDREWKLPFLALVIAFGVAEATALHVEIRKESHSLSLSLIPLMYGVIYVSPAELMFAYLLGGAPILLWIRKSDLLKTLWNSCLFVAESALAAVIVRTFLGDRVPETALEWLVPLVAVLAAELMSLLAVPLVIMAVDTKFRPNLFADVGRSQILAALGGSFTVTAVSASVGDPYMVLFSLIPVLGIGALLRSTGHLSQRFEDLQQLHMLTSALANERGARTLDTGLASLVEIMRSRSAGLVTIDADDVAHIRALVDDTFEDLEDGETAHRVLELVKHDGVTQLADTDDDPRVQALLRDLGAQKILAARVLGEVDRTGVLFISDRMGMRRDFTADELRLFGSLADTLSARLSNDYLVEQLEVQAQHDALTGLANRLSFEIALTASLAGHHQSGVVVMIDLDRFKEINDSLGHDTGDRLLIEVGDRLRAATRSTDLVARFGGDEFAMLLTSRPTDPDGDLERRIDEIHANLIQKVDIDGITFEIGASLGVARWPDQGDTSATLLRRADAAMYEAKRNQLGVVWYSPEVDADAPRRLDLYLSVGKALEQGELTVHFQPKVSLADGSITGAEALARWIHPAYGMVPPTEFIPLIVQSGLVGRLTRLVLRRSAEAVADLRAIGIDINIAVNLTPRDLLDPTLVPDLGQITSEVGIEPSSLSIEITEDAMVVDFDTSITMLTHLRELGCDVAIDDFGTGYSSLQHLHRLPVDQLKIDRSFIDALTSDEGARAIVSASINLANDLGLATVAEGIENDGLLETLRAMGCDEVQGYHISRPVAFDDLRVWIQTWDPARAAAHGHERSAARAVAASSPARGGDRPPIRAISNHRR